MNLPKCTDEDYINFVFASPKQLTATEAARVQPESQNAPAHDAFTRLLSRLCDESLLGKLTESNNIIEESNSFV